jgi:hypothetical protein
VPELRGIVAALVWKTWSLLRFVAVAAAVLALSVTSCATTSHERHEAESSREQPRALASFPELPDVTLTSVTLESAPVSHCKVAGVIGSDIRFELLLPREWNGKFVMGGGGGFVGSVMNVAVLYGALQSGSLSPSGSREAPNFAVLARYVDLHRSSLPSPV